jgi:hypothetical protein
VFQTLSAGKLGHVVPGSVAADAAGTATTGTTNAIVNRPAAIAERLNT